MGVLMTNYTDDEVREAIDKCFDCYDDGYSAGICRWAAEQYLKAKPVIEFYADKEKYDDDKMVYEQLQGAHRIIRLQEATMKLDVGQRAREFLNQIKS